MKWSKALRGQAIELFEYGYADKAVADRLNLPSETVRKWYYTYRALGKEALFMTKHKTYSPEVKAAAARDFLEDGLSKVEIMRKHGIASKSALDRWIRLYRERGPQALEPKPKGRPKGQPAVYANREEELEARVRELELELEIQKRINALADEIEQRRHRS